MDNNDLFNSLKKMSSEFASSYCIVNGNIMELNKLKDLGYNDFLLKSKINIPFKLYRYYPNTYYNDEKTGTKINYSLQALQDNTVFLQTPTEFDDVYDSDVNINYHEYEHYRLIAYCKKCGINVDESIDTNKIGDTLVTTLLQYYKENKNFDNVFIKTTGTEFENLSNQLFFNRIYDAQDLTTAVSKTIKEEYDDFVNYLKTIFRISCFTTSPYSQLMWANYADNHRGFCVEYTILPNDNLYNNIYYNLFPLIYCKARPNITADLMEFTDHELTQEGLWKIYFNGTLRKSIDWVFQNEWRLLLPLNHKSNKFNIKFYPITKVYLGNRMACDKRKKIIDICKEKNIDFIGMTRNTDIFEMQDCTIKCDKCLL